MQSKDVAVFWDYESCDVSSSASGYDVAQRIRSVALTFGIVKQIKAYVNLHEPLTSFKLPQIRLELQMSGISIADCPQKNDHDNAIERIMLVDMLAYAVDNPSLSTLILISADRNFAYAMATLRMRGFTIVLISPDTVHASLKAQASECLDWHLDVLYANHEPLQNGTSIESTNASGSQADYHRLKHSQLRSQTSLYGRMFNRERNTNASGDNVHTCNLAQQDTRLVISRSLDVSSQKNFGPEIGSSASTVTQTPGGSLAVVEGFEVPALEYPPPIRPSSATISSDNASVSDKHDNEQQNHPPSVLDVPTTNAISLTHFLPPGNISTLVSPEASSSTLPPVTAQFVDHVPSSKVQAVSSTSIVSPSAIPVVPLIYRPLVESLQSFRSKGVLQPLRSQFAASLITKNANLYKSAGVKKFSQYVSLAEAAGIVELGGKDGGDWIRLRPEFQDAKAS
ncbi:hypothetical protein C0995_010671 [Termitomyces sp. Mi166|nr:hypothetical protein C0995_010671 [Termitomyces sp. Mi166\